MDPERSSTKSTSASWCAVFLVCVPQLASPVGCPPPPVVAPEPLAPAVGLVLTVSPPPPPPPLVPPTPTGGGVESQAAKKIPTDEKIAAPAKIVPIISLLMTSPCLQCFGERPADRRTKYLLQ